MQTRKDKTRVVIYVGEWRVEGDIHILAESRLTDALNSRNKDFLAVTDAVIYEAKTDDVVARTSFLDINRTTISIIYTVD
jgi:hypothetical protein